jgi:hypothetical protein
MARGWYRRGGAKESEIRTTPWLTAAILLSAEGTPYLIERGPPPGAYTFYNTNNSIAISMRSTGGSRVAVRVIYATS